MAVYQGHFYDGVDHSRSSEGPTADSSAVLTVGLTALAVLFAAAVARAAVSARVLTLGLLRSVGRYSYGMYVFHVLVLYAADVALHARSLGRPAASMPTPVAKLTLFALATVVSYAAAWVSYHAYEKHFLRLKQRFESPTAESVGRL